MTATGVMGAWPVTISHIITHREYTSVAEDNFPIFRSHCSGAMYPRVPAPGDVRVIFVVSVDNRQLPRSDSLATMPPRCSSCFTMRIFDGFRSKCSATSCCLSSTLLCSQLTPAMTSSISCDVNSGLSRSFPSWIIVASEHSASSIRIIIWRRSLLMLIPMGWMMVRCSSLSKFSNSSTATLGLYL